jgi:hypothetical protein
LTSLSAAVFSLTRSSSVSDHFLSSSYADLRSRHQVEGIGQLAELVRAVEVDHDVELAGRQRLGARPQLPRGKVNGPVDNARGQERCEEDETRSHGVAPPRRCRDRVVHHLHGQLNIEHAEDGLVRGVSMAVFGTAGGVLDRIEDPEDPMTVLVLGHRKACALFSRHLLKGLRGRVAESTGLRLLIDTRMELTLHAGEGDLPLLVVDADRVDTRLVAEKRDVTANAGSIVLHHA